MPPWTPPEFPLVTPDFRGYGFAQRERRRACLAAGYEPLRVTWGRSWHPHATDCEAAQRVAPFVARVVPVVRAYTAGDFDSQAPMRAYWAPRWAARIVEVLTWSLLTPSVLWHIPRVLDGLLWTCGAPEAIPAIYAAAEALGADPRGALRARFLPRGLDAVLRRCRRHPASDRRRALARLWGLEVVGD